MLVALYQLTRWANASKQDVTKFSRKVQYGNEPLTSWHNQRCAFDFSGIDGTVDGNPFN